MTSDEVKAQLTGVTQGKDLLPIEGEPFFFHTPWETRSNGAQVTTVWTYSTERGPAATPAVWIERTYHDARHDNSETQQSKLHDAVKRLKDNGYRAAAN